MKSSMKEHANRRAGCISSITPKLVKFFKALANTKNPRAKARPMLLGRGPGKVVSTYQSNMRVSDLT
eukprot:3827920-Amphidinium_carterae.1